MLFFVLPVVRPAGPLSGYFSEWGKPVANRVHIVSFDRMTEIGGSRGAVIFRLPTQQASREEEVAGKISRFVTANAPSLWQLNRPGQVMRRAALLRRLHELGRNDFDAYCVDELDDRVRYPVYLRVSDQQDGMSALLANRAELDRAIKAAIAAGQPRDSLLVTEFVDTATDGIYRKYSAMKVGDAIIAHHIFFSTNWVVRAKTLLPPTQAMVDEEAEFQNTNPHRAALAEAFALAGVDYGRIDYGVKDGRVQVWEINTNPVILQPRLYYRRMQMPNKARFAATLNDSLSKLSRWRAPLVPEPATAADVLLGVYYEQRP